MSRRSIGFGAAIRACASNTRDCAPIILSLGTRPKNPALLADQLLPDYDYPEHIPQPDFGPIVWR